MIYQTRDKSINKLQNNIDNYNTDQNIAGMINHAPTNWILMTHNKTTLGNKRLTDVLLGYTLYKSSVSRQINKLNQDKFRWQRSFHDEIIRTGNRSLYNTRKYIINNPANWKLDENNIKNYSVKGQALRGYSGFPSVTGPAPAMNL